MQYAQMQILYNIAGHIFSKKFVKISKKWYIVYVRLTKAEFWHFVYILAAALVNNR